jgi:hypothetical protein
VVAQYYQDDNAIMELSQKINETDHLGYEMLKQMVELR